jgi:glycosyltransferase involved in cell wall biosynthesis
MPYNIRMVSTYPPRRCGIGTFSRDLANALEHFTGEVGSIRVSVIDKDNLPYDIPVDLIINQYNPKSWKTAINDIITRAKESSNPTVVILQHEYGLDPDDGGHDGDGRNYVELTKAFMEAGLVTLVYLHTVVDEPDTHQKLILQELAEYSDGLIVTTENAIHLLEAGRYGISHLKLKHIDHGIRMHHPSQYDRLAIKEEFGLDGCFLVTTLGLLSPDKGIPYGIQGYGRFLKESCTDAQRQKMLYLIAGQCHPEFVKAKGGQPYREYQQTLTKALDVSDLKWCTAKELSNINAKAYDVIFLDTFLDEGILLKLYGATNVMLLPYLNMHQISSGILADTLGSGRVAITTKFRYALELIHSNKPCREGVVMGRYARGILVDAGALSVEQIARALDYLVFHKRRHLVMEKEAHKRGYQMRWQNSAWELLQHIEFLKEQKEMESARGVSFKREKLSIYQRNKQKFPFAQAEDTVFEFEVK